MQTGLRARKIVGVIAATVVAAIVILYAYNRFEGFLAGPSIEIDSPPNGSTVNTVLLTLEGIAKQVAFITLNDRQIFVNEEGAIYEQMLLFPGYNIISLKATDRFGRKIEKRLELIYTEVDRS